MPRAAREAIWLIEAGRYAIWLIGHMAQNYRPLNFKKYFCVLFSIITSHNKHNKWCMNRMLDYSAQGQLGSDETGPIILGRVVWAES